MSEFDFSIVIPTKDRPDKLFDCLKSALKLKYEKEKFEIIIADGSSENYKERINDFLLSQSNYLITYFHQENDNPAIARNTGIKKSKGNYILFVDDDCILDENLLIQHKKFHELYENSAILGNTKWHPNIKNTPFLSFLKDSKVYNPSYLLSGIVEITPDLYYKEFPLFITTNVSIKKELIIKAGYFNEDFKWWEDIELGKRLAKMNIKFYYNEFAMVYHNHQPTIQNFSERQEHAGKTSLTFYKNYPEMEAALEINIAKSFTIEFLEEMNRALLNYIEILEKLWYFEFNLKSIQIKEINFPYISQNEISQNNSIKNVRLKKLNDVKLKKLNDVKLKKLNNVKLKTFQFSLNIPYIKRFAKNLNIIKEIIQENKEMIQEDRQIIQENRQIIQKNRQIIQENRQIIQENKQMIQEHELFFKKLFIELFKSLKLFIDSYNYNLAIIKENFQRTEYISNKLILYKLYRTLFKNHYLIGILRALNEN